MTAIMMATLHLLVLRCFMVLMAVASGVGCTSHEEGRRPMGVSHGVTQIVWENSVCSGPLNTTFIVESVEGSWGNPDKCSATSVEFTGVIRPQVMGLYTFNCSVLGGSAIMWLDDHLLCGTQALFAPAPAGGYAPLPPYMNLTTVSYVLRVQLVRNCSSGDIDRHPFTFSLRWSLDGTTFVPVSTTVLSPQIPASQNTRLVVQRNLATGWGTWFRPNALAATLLPERATLTVGMCQLSTGVCLDPRGPFTPEQDRGQEEPKSAATGLAGMHAWDRSYWQLHLMLGDANVSLEWSGSGSVHPGDFSREQLALVATMVGSTNPSEGSGSVNASDYVLTVTGGYVLGGMGQVAVVSTRAQQSPAAAPMQQLILHADGLRRVAASALTPTAPMGLVNNSLVAENTIFLLLTTGTAALSTQQPPPTMTAVKQATAQARAAAKFTIPTTMALGSNPPASRGASTPRGADRRVLEAGGTAMQAGLMWNTIFHPTQAGPFVQVSRSFAQQPYEIFEWDTYFGALMLSYDARALGLAVSSLIQVTKGKTLGPYLDGHGFVPGYSKGGIWLSEDRTERPVGAQIVLKVWQRWNSMQNSTVAPEHDRRNLSWLLEVLYPDLFDWHAWMWNERRVGPLMLGGLGSDNCLAVNRSEPHSQTGPSLMWCKESWGMGRLQGARFESLDNSPMYDSPGGNYTFWNTSTLRMQVYDIGQTSAMISECEALAKIADLLGRQADAKLLRQRQNLLSSLVQQHMWNGELAVYANVLFNGTSYPRVSPTSFYPMLSGLATDEQAVAMVTRWLTNASRFCVPPNASAWPPQQPPPATTQTLRNAPSMDPPQCYWGMPSISADDPAYMVAGGTSGIYWRGQTWAPQAYLVYAALQRYDHLPAARNARKGLCAQQLSLLLSAWNAHHHVCENYPSVRVNNSGVNADFDCTGNQFYTWGGLPAFMALSEAGFYA
eukprot:m.868267 g.868267  ORF g.868267 m.868267 type:complete len:949 (-) comp23560_c0_seq2:326-3172(-)